MNDIVQQANAAVNREGSPQFQESLSFEPAGFWIRWGALIIDSIVAAVISTLVQLPLTLLIVKNSMESPGQINWGYQILSYLVGMTISVVYSGYFYSKKGATPGKMLFGLTVLDNHTGTYLSFWRGAGRDVIGRLLSAIPIFLGYLIVAFRSDKRALHDLLFATCVVRRKHSYNHVQG